MLFLKTPPSGPLAQLVEQLTFNQWVAGSNPARLTTRIGRLAVFRDLTPGSGSEFRRRVAHDSAASILSKTAHCGAAALAPALFPAQPSGAEDTVRWYWNGTQR